MATHKHPSEQDPRLPGEAEVARVYAAGAQQVACKRGCKATPRVQRLRRRGPAVAGEA